MTLSVEGSTLKATERKAKAKYNSIDAALLYAGIPKTVKTLRNDSANCKLWIMLILFSDACQRVREVWYQRQLRARSRTLSHDLQLRKARVDATIFEDLPRKEKNLP